MAVADTLAPHAAVVSCAHCGLAVPEGRLPYDGARPFCCTGCATAWQVLHEFGLERYYDMATRREQRVEATGRSFEEFDHDAFRSRHVRRRRDGLDETDLYL
ncbi:MAG: heavy metal translocating P-type ATPase metal-binding domain-containing protein [bacterium]